jgi:DNA-3-methyladenine glycosylase
MNTDFFKQSTTDVAKQLLGKVLKVETFEGIASGIIVETEAYLHNDPAAHSFRGPNLKNASLFKQAGTVYIYFTYGMYYCFNVATNIEGIGEGVLIRAIEPIQGLSLMKKRRGIDDLKNLTNGPAKLVIALGIKKDMNGTTIGEQIKIENSDSKGFDIVETVRVGISKAQEEKLRFYIKDNPYVSKK